MTYEGLATLILRIAGFFAIATVLFSLPSAFFAGGRGMPLLLLFGIGLVPGAVLIVASKPLGRFLAAGIE